MENVGLQGLAALVILLPGFLCARLVQWLCVRPKQTELDKITESLLYSFVVYVIFVLMTGGSLPLALMIQHVGESTTYGVQLKPVPIAVLAAISFVLALAIGGIVTNDLSGWVFRKARLTQRTTRSSVWSDAFHDRGGVLQVELGDGRRVMGWLRYYSDEPKDESLFLENAAWVEGENLIAINGPGILITKKVGINWIEFRNAETSDEPTVAEL